MILQKLRDKWFRLFAILLPFGIILFNTDFKGGIDTTTILVLAVKLCSIIAMVEGVRFIVYKSRNWFRGFIRVLFMIIAGLACVTIALGISALLQQVLKTGSWQVSVAVDSNITINNEKVYLGPWGFAFLNALFILPVLLIAFEITWHYAELRRTAKENEKLEKEKLKAELQQLKGIVNPHFLFNNLNSLSSLIAENPVLAQEFLDELTKVFRYLLRNNETELTTLSQEMEFIRSYHRLLQTRYGQAVLLEAKIDSTHEDLLLPPLTLQLLIENAVKHNRLQKDDPLRIELATEPGNKLSVRNNILKKEGQVESTGIGLQNINARYRMLKQPGVQIEKTDHSFEVVITLIENSDD